MQTTTHYALQKPDPNDTYNKATDNSNMDAIDTQMYNNAQAAAAAQTAANGATAAGAANDTVIGNRTADPTQAPNGLTGTLTQFLSWITNRIKAITGTANWYDAPPTTLTAAEAHMTNMNNPHNVTAAQVGAIPTSSKGVANGVATTDANNKVVQTANNSDNLGGEPASYYLPSSSYNAGDVLAKIKTVDGSGSGLDADTLDGHDSAYFLAATAQAADSAKLGGQPSGYYASASSVKTGYEFTVAQLMDGSGATGGYISTQTSSYTQGAYPSILNVSANVTYYLEMSWFTLGTNSYVQLYDYTSAALVGSQIHTASANVGQASVSRTQVTLTANHVYGLYFTSSGAGVLGARLVGVA